MKDTSHGQRNSVVAMMSHADLLESAGSGAPTWLPRVIRRIANCVEFFPPNDDDMQPRKLQYPH